MIFMYSNIILGPFTKLTVKRAPRFKLPELETFILKLLVQKSGWRWNTSLIKSKQASK
mgnify:CR=1 FL=1